MAKTEQRYYGSTVPYSTNGNHIPYYGSTCEFLPDDFMIVDDGRRIYIERVANTKSRCSWCGSEWQENEKHKGTCAHCGGPR